MKLVRVLSAAALVMGVAGRASAQTAQQTVTFSVTDVATINVSGNPSAMSAPSDSSAVTNSATTYDVTTNSTVAKKITAYLDAAMPTGTTLAVNLADPDGAGAAVSAGNTVLTATTSGTAQNLVTGITQLQATGKQITYTLRAGVTASAATNLTRVVTFTIQ
jgi:hypothetical protein